MLPRVSVGMWLCGDYGTEERRGSICPSVPVGLHDTERGKRNTLGIRKAGLIIWALHFAPVCTDCVSKVERTIMLWKLNFHYSIIYLLYGKMPDHSNILVITMQEACLALQLWTSPRCMYFSPVASTKLTFVPVLYPMTEKYELSMVS